MWISLKTHFYHIFVIRSALIPFSGLPYGVTCSICQLTEATVWTEVRRPERPSWSPRTTSKRPGKPIGSACWGSGSSWLKVTLKIFSEGKAGGARLPTGDVQLSITFGYCTSFTFKSKLMWLHFGPLLETFGQFFITAFGHTDSPVTKKYTALNILFQ